MPMVRPWRTAIRILFISSNRIGDAVITCGVIDRLIRTQPDCRITIACGPAAAGVFARMPNLERMILVEKHKSNIHWFRLWAQVVLTWWDLVVDIRGSALAYLVPTGRRVVRKRRPGRMFEQHGAMLGMTPAPLPVVWTAAADRAKAAALLPAGPVIGLGVTANWAPKMWPAERFAALFEALRAGPFPGAVAAVFSGPGETERAMAAPALALLPGAIDLRGTLSLPEAAACIQRCAIYIGNDSGLMHLAAASGTPTIGLCAITNDRAEEMAPAGLHAAWALPDSQAKGVQAMEALSVESAYAACLRVLAAKEA
jgi:heptosyltransferase-3